MTEQMDALDRLANDAFGGRVVRKDLVRRVKVGANVPVYVLEFLLGKYCATDDPAAIGPTVVPGASPLPSRRGAAIVEA